MVTTRCCVWRVDTICPRSILTIRLRKGLASERSSEGLEKVELSLRNGKSTQRTHLTDLMVAPQHDHHVNGSVYWRVANGRRKGDSDETGGTQMR